MDRLSEGYKRAIDNVWGPIKQILGSKSEFLDPPNFLFWTPCSSHDREKLCKQESTLFLNKYQYFSKGLATNC